MPVPMRCTKSTARMVARVGRASMLQRLRRPKAARTKTTRKDSRRELMDHHLLSVVDEESERYVAPNACRSAASEVHDSLDSPDCSGAARRCSGLLGATF